MPRFSSVSRCAICGKEVAQAGPARQWVHLNEFYAKADHPADPASKSYVAPRREAAPPPAPKREAPKPKSDGDKPKTLAELRRRLLQGTSEIAPEDSAARRRRIAALDAGTETGPSETDVAARKLRLMRLQAAEEERKR